MKINIFELIGIGYIGLWTYYLISRVGTLPYHGTEVYTWLTVLMGFVSVLTPLIIGYLAGVSDRRRW